VDARERRVSTRPSIRGVGKTLWSTCFVQNLANPMLNASNACRHVASTDVRLVRRRQKSRHCLAAARAGIARASAECSDARTLRGGLTFISPNPLSVRHRLSPTFLLDNSIWDRPRQTAENVSGEYARRVRRYQVRQPALLMRGLNCSSGGTVDSATLGWRSSLERSAKRNFSRAALNAGQTEHLPYAGTVTGHNSEGRNG
jgi:hypothetical protein